jgi:hypothetical protein
VRYDSRGVHYDSGCWFMECDCLFYSLQLGKHGNTLSDISEQMFPHSKIKVVTHNLQNSYKR